MNRSIALVLCWLTTASLFGQGNVVFQDDFSDNRNSWWEGSNEDYFFKVTNGTYVFDNYSQTTYTIAKNVGLTQDDDFVIETTIRKVSGVDNQVYGLVWGYQDADNCYTFSLSGNGYYLLGKWSGGTWVDLIAWTTSSAIQTYSGYAVTNRLKAEKTGDRVDLYINDTYVNSYTWERPAGNQVGFVVTKTQRIEIEELVIRKAGGSGYQGATQYGDIPSWDNPYGHNTTIRSVAFSADGNYVASVDLSTQIKMWDVRSGVAVRTLTIQASVEDIVFSADATKAIWWDNSRMVGLYDMNSASNMTSMSSPSTYGAEWSSPCAISPDGQFGAYRDEDFNVAVIQTYSGGRMSVLRGSQNVYSMSFAGDGRTIAVGYAAANISVWDLYSGEMRRTLMGYETYYIRAIAMSRDGSLVASAGEKVCKVSDTYSGRDVALLTGHTDAIDAITFSPDGRLIATGGTDHSVRVWDVQSGSELRQFTDATGAIKALAFSPDGRTLAAGGVDHTVRIWNISDLSSGGYQGESHFGGQQTLDAWTMGSQAFDRGEYETAMSFFQQALSIAEQNQNVSGQADALVSIAITLERVGQPDMARDYCWRAIQTGASDHRPYYTLAKISYDRGNYSEAESICQDGLARYPDNADLKRVKAAILTVSANNHYNSANYGDAVNLYHQSIQMYDQDSNVFMLLGFSYYALGHYGSAVDALERAEQLNPNIGQENSSFYEILNYCRSNR